MDQLSKSGYPITAQAIDTDRQLLRYIRSACLHSKRWVSNYRDRVNIQINLVSSIIILPNEPSLITKFTGFSPIATTRQSNQRPTSGGFLPRSLRHDYHCRGDVILFTGDIYFGAALPKALRTQYSVVLS